MKIVANEYNVSIKDLKSKRKNSSIVIPRQIAMYLIRKMLDTPYTKIGIIFGGKDHSTVMSGVEKVEKELKERRAALENKTETPAVP